MLQDLETNSYNSWGLPVEKTVSFQTICDEAQKMDKNSLLRLLNRKRKQLGLYQASYGLYYLGNRYLQEGDFSGGMYYLQIATDKYLNPLAMLRLARIYFSTPDRIKANFPQLEIEFEQDLAKAYYYINAAHKLSELIKTANKDAYVYDVFVGNGQAILESYSLGSTRGQFDFKTAEKALPTQMTELEKAYRKMYLP